MSGAELIEGRRLDIVTLGSIYRQLWMSEFVFLQFRLSSLEGIRYDDNESESQTYCKETVVRMPYVPQGMNIRHLHRKETHLTHNEQ